ncbi:DNA repair protein RadC [Thermosulfidibacter takaii ABI70S6]|uniref:DNA repair protein RadC n=1 Tax=Thermosulfidibacter takaii (strain DSM 17441 / JCM 13301 / NBRC 103674 / ABI70S6) TaxID=1298851 RepID=A0A0S3QRK4_THET7|nr:DNA repair protein RadC [Thermosulfidibacter takaii]BAT70964.1 DNA repair protein RadC [Thermosulfidibacter takaii ABI70S6]
MKKRIKDIPKEDRPRERFIKLGPSALSNAELLAVILGKGSKEKDVLQLASEVLNILEKDPEKATLDTLTNIKGIGQAKAIQIKAAFELAKRLLIKDGLRITSARQLFQLNMDITGMRQECLALITVDGSGKFIKRRILTKGSLNKTIIHPREIFFYAIEDGAYGIFLIHNHPSGELTPSQEDIKITQRVAEAGKILGIYLLDHLIVSRKGFFSFKEQGLLNGHSDSQT